MAFPHFHWSFFCLYQIFLKVIVNLQSILTTVQVEISRTFVVWVKHRGAWNNDHIGIFDQLVLLLHNLKQNAFEKDLFILGDRHDVTHHRCNLFTVIWVFPFQDIWPGTLVYLFLLRKSDVFQKELPHVLPLQSQILTLSGRSLTSRIRTSVHLSYLAWLLL